MHKRIWSIKIIFGLIAAILISRLTFWQVIKAESLSLQSSRQRIGQWEIPARRGEIFFADGFPMVENRESYLAYIDPSIFGKSPEAVLKLNQVLPATISASNKRWQVVATGVDPQQKKRIEDLSLPTLGFEQEIVRTYPEGSPSAHLAGFLGKDESGNTKGYFGLEGFYDKELAGKPGRLIQERDGLDRPIITGDENRIAARDGRDIKTSIDRTLQFLAFTKLQKALQKYGAVSGTIIGMEPKTGRILFATSIVDAGQDFYPDPIIGQSYEPGSTFKVISMAAALDGGVITKDTICTICYGPAQIGEYSIKTWNDKYYPNSTMTDVIVHSDNVGMVFVGRSLGLKKLLKYIHDFGFGTSTNVDMQGEQTVSLREEKTWTEIDVATATFGQGIAVTPLQMLRAVSAIANNGKLPTVRVVDEIGGRRIADESSGFTQVISAKTAADITQMMINAIDLGEAKWTKPVGFSIAGKTGTAQIPIDGHYEKDKTIASFVGFAPALDPKFAMLVTLREPKTSQWGSETAAPLWFDMAKEIYRYYHIM